MNSCQLLTRARDEGSLE